MSLSSTFKPRHFCFVVSQLTLQPFVYTVLLFEHQDHWLEVADVYRFGQYAFRVVVCDNFTDARHQRLVHWAVGVVLRFAAGEWAVERFRHGV